MQNCSDNRAFRRILENIKQTIFNSFISLKP